MEGSDDDGEVEPIPGGMELAFVEDEEEEIRQARLSIPQDDEQQLGDF